MSQRSTIILLVIIAAIVFFPLTIGLAGGAIGLLFGLIGGIIGAVFGLIGGLLGLIGDLIGGIFSWPFGFSCSWFDTDILLLATIILIVALMSGKRYSTNQKSN